MKDFKVTPEMLKVLEQVLVLVAVNPVVASKMSAFAKEKPEEKKEEKKD
jgi:hypothetical protein